MAGCTAHIACGEDLGWGPAPHQNLLPPPPVAAISPNCREWRDLSIIWGRQFPLIDSKTCLKVSSPFSVPASQHNGVGFLLSPPPFLRGAQLQGQGTYLYPFSSSMGFPWSVKLRSRGRTASLLTSPRRWMLLPWR